jgi:predicted  nucleic acid-binding Zn-ribbon protein
MVKDNVMELDAALLSHQPVNRRKETAKVLVLEPALGNAAELPSTEMIAELEEKLSQARARQMAFSGERKKISLAAHMGSVEDRARLDQLNKEGAILSDEIEGIEAAINDAQTRIANAKANATIEAEHQKRREVAQLADELRGHAQKIDELWRASIAEYLILQAKLEKIAQSGVARPSRFQVQTACRRALIAAFIGSPLRLELLAPGGRHTVANLVAAWAGNAEAWAKQALPRRANGKDAA